MARPSSLLMSSLAAAGLGLGLGLTLGGVALQDPPFLWPTLGHTGFLALGALLGLAWAWAWGLGWRLAFGWDLATGLRHGATSLLPGLLGLALPLVLRIHLPAPHDFPLRTLQIFLAAQGLTCLAVALALSLARLRRDPQLETLPARSLALRLVGVALVPYLLAGAWAGPWHMTGDCPHYVLMTQSLAYDHDVDLNNDYDSKVWKRFYDFPELGRQMPNQADGRQISEHKPGLSLALVPGYRLWDVSGLRMELALMAALGGGLFFLLCLALGFSRQQALWGWMVLCFSAPWLEHSYIVMVEMPAGLLLLVMLAAWEGVLPRWWAGIALAALPWLHIRFMPVAAALVLVEAVDRRRRGLRIWPALAWGALGLGTALLYNRMEYGSLNVAKAYEQRQLGWDVLVKVGNVVRYSCGLMIDQEYGWLTCAPVFALAFYGLWSLARRRPRTLWLTLAPSLVYLGPLVVFPWWFSGLIPNRYVVPLAPFFALWTLEAWRAWGPRPVFKALAWVSWFWGLALSVLPWFVWGRENGQNWSLKFLGAFLHVKLTPFFPTFMFDDPKAYLWVAGLLIAGGLYARRLGPPAP